MDIMRILRIIVKCFIFAWDLEKSNGAFCAPTTPFSIRYVITKIEEAAYNYLFRFAYYDSGFESASKYSRYFSNISYATTKSMWTAQEPSHSTASMITLVK